MRTVEFYYLDENYHPITTPGESPGGFSSKNYYFMTLIILMLYSKPLKKIL